jgi:hypothetical protein
MAAFTMPAFLSDIIKIESVNNSVIYLLILCFTLLDFLVFYWFQLHGFDNRCHLLFGVGLL